MLEKKEIGHKVQGSKRYEQDEGVLRVRVEEYLPENLKKELLSKFKAEKTEGGKNV